jgi:LmbE family N-acetylglucosaminyl deacetylase
MNPYRAYVAELERLLQEAKHLPLGGLERLSSPTVDPTARLALIFSPHPDDEVIVGGLALRLRREAGFRVVNVAVTHGSLPARQAERWSELTRCCDFIGFELIGTAPGGLGPVNAETRSADPAGWLERVRKIASILLRLAPHVVFFPHGEDWNSTHVGTHHLLVDALASLGPEFQTYTVETEFWAASSVPNVMLELGAHDVADLVAALGFHVGEVQRNPYHLSLPAHMIDNVRRGGELVLGQGAAPPPFTFATLYRLRRWQEGGFVPVLPRGLAVSVRDSVAELMP